MIFGIDTSCSCAKAALYEDGLVLAEDYADGMKTHSVKCLPMIDRLFYETGRKVSEVGLIGIITGPGSFTGLRIGVATAKSIAYSINVPLIGINTLDFLARSVSDINDSIVCPLIDARNTNVYCNAYIKNKPLWECGVKASSDLAEELLLLSKDTKCKVILTGDGAEKYQEIYQERLKDRMLIAPKNEVLGTAGCICEIAEERKSDAVDCFSLNVNYYRMTQAERMRNGSK